MQCELCGRDEELVRAIVEGTELKVCRKCSGFGKVLGRVNPSMGESRKEHARESQPEIVQIIIPDYQKVLKKARESAELTQEELAKRINERESLIHKIESGHFKPSIATIGKLEKFFRIKLIESHKIEPEEQKASASSHGLTIGDLIKLKK